MTKVYQTKFGYGQGNCLLACVASLLDKNIEDIPDFNLSGIGWFEEMYEWCMNEGLGVVLLSPRDLESALVMNLHGIMLFRVVGLDDEMHAVIGQFTRKNRQPHPDMSDKELWQWEANIVHDPNPRGGFELGNLEHVVLVVPQLAVSA